MIKPNNIPGLSNTAVGAVNWQAPRLTSLGSVAQLTESGSIKGQETLVGPGGSCNGGPFRAKYNINEC